MTFAELKEMLDKMSPEELNKNVEGYDGRDDCYVGIELIRDEDYPENFVFLI